MFSQLSGNRDSFSLAESNTTLVMATVDDLSAKTIEFLRARLLAERATSKSARQQAQEMSEKVNNLHIRLETEIKHRKEAEAAMEKVFLALKAKGVLMDRVLLFPTGLNGNSTGDASPSDYGEGAKELSGEVPCSPIQHGKGERDESSTQSMGILECVTELHGILSVVEGTEDTNGTSDAPGANPVERKARVPVRDIAEHPHRCLMEHDHDKKEVCQGHRMLDGTPIVKGDIGTGQSIQQGLCITTKLKALLQQIEEEVGALPEEQPLCAKLQGVAGHLANMLDRGQEAGLESDHVESSNQPEIIISSSERVTTPEAKNCTHMEEGIDRRERLAKNLSSSPKAQLKRRPLMSSTSTLSTPSMENTFLESNAFYERKPSCDLLNGANRDAYVGPCPFLDRGPLAPRVFQYDNPHLQITYPPSMADWGSISRSNSHMGFESSYLIEVPSPKSSDALSVGDKLLPKHGRHNDDVWSPARASSGFEGQNAWFPARLDRQSRAMLPNGYILNDISNEGVMEQGYNHPNMHLQGRFPHSLLHSHQERDPRNSMIRAVPWQQLKDRSSYNDEAASVMDHRNGRLGGILMALDAARQHVQGDELMGPPTPMAVDAWLKRGYLYGDSGEQLPPEFQRDTRRSCSHAAIVQLPPSPTSEHGYSPFERPRGGHRRSSSVSTNFMMSEWDNSQPPRGEVHLGNGITLYTD